MQSKENIKKKNRGKTTQLVRIKSLMPVRNNSKTSYLIPEHSSTPKVCNPKIIKENIGQQQHNFCKQNWKKKV